MDVKTVFTKTAKGVTQINQKTQSLSRQSTKVLKAIDGKSNLNVLADKVDLAIPTLEKELNELRKEGYIKTFEVKQEIPLSAFGDDEDDFDFTKPVKSVAPALKQPVVSFGPSGLRQNSLNEQVERAAPPEPAAPPMDEAAKIAADIAARREREAAAAIAAEDARIAAEAKEAARAAAQKAQAEARARAEREAQIRARLEIEARARKEAEARAVEEAKRAEVAAASARAELEAKLAAEAKQRAAMEASRAQLTQQQQEQAKVAQRELAEARAKAEAEAKALAAARTKMEAEAKALAEARAASEEAAKRQNEELASAQKALRAQLKAEIEAKVRAEMEELLKSDIEESARAEVEAAVIVEAQDEARRQLEEQLTTEREALAKIEAEAKQRAEEEARKMLAEQETRLRAEMEARFQEIAVEKAKAEEQVRRMAEAQAQAAAQQAAELAVRLKAEEDARRVAEEQAEARRREAEAERERYEAIAKQEAAARQKADAEAKAAAQAAAALAEKAKADELRARRLEARAREEAEARKKAQAEMEQRLAAETQARIEAQERAQAAASSSSAELETERRAREEAETRARREAKARAIASQAVAQQVAEKERLAQLAEQRLAEEREARERAEAKAYADERAAELQRQAQVARLKELAEQAERDKLTEAVEEVEGRKRKRYKPRKEIPVGRLIVFGVLGLSLAAVAALHYLPLTPVNTRLEKALAQWIHDDVSSERLRVALFPSPYVKLDQLALGKAYDAKAASGRLNMDIGSVLGDRFVVQSMELNDVTIALEALPRALKWADANNRGDALEIDTITLRNVKTELRGVGIEVFDAEIGLDKKGRVTRATARTRDGKWTLDAVRDTSVPANEAGEQPWKIDFSARNWTPQMAGGIPISSLTLKGTWLGDDIVFPEAEARLFEGSFKGSAKVNLSKGIVATGEFNVERAKIDEIVGTFTRVVATTGKVEGAIAVTLAASSVGGLLEQPTIVGNFTARDGSISNIDLVQAMRNPGSVGGQTKFSELTGKLRVSDGVVRLEGMKLSGGVLFAGGSVGIVANSGALTGNVQAEIRSNVAQDRANFSVSGTVARPALKRGG